MTDFSLTLPFCTWILTTIMYPLAPNHQDKILIRETTSQKEEEARVLIKAAEAELSKVKTEAEGRSMAELLRQQNEAKGVEVLYTRCTQSTVLDRFHTTNYRPYYRWRLPRKLTGSDPWVLRRQKRSRRRGRPGLRSCSPRG